MSLLPEAPAGPPVSVVIPTYRRPRLVLEVVRATLQQLGRGDELIVVDDGSGDETVDRLCELHDSRLKVLIQPNQGAAVARNRGVAEATHDLIVFIDDDEIPEPGCIAAHRGAQSYPGRRAVVGRPILVVPHRGGERRIPPGVRTPGVMALDASASMRKADIVSVGGFDTEMRGWQDVDLGIRLRAAGVELAVCDEALVSHRIDRPYAEFRRQQLQRGRGVARGVVKHGAETVGLRRPRHLVDRLLVNLGARSALFAWVAPAALWGVVRIAGRLGSWNLQGLAASRAGMVLMARSRALESDRLAREGLDPAPPDASGTPRPGGA